MIEREGCGEVMKEFDNMIIHFIQEQSLLTRGSRILIACSGGVDSMVLLHFFASNREKLGVEVGAVHVDHMLRGEESAADGELVRAFCNKLNVPFFGGRVPVPEIIAKEGGNVQAVCREGRYAYFMEVMEEHRYDRLATAHHAEDQLETVLMQVTKGSNPLGIPIKREIGKGMLIRPFLPAVKAILYAYAAYYKIIFREDPSNTSDAYMRNRFRQNVVPHILRENLSAAEKVVLMTTNLQEDEALLQSLAKDYLKENIAFTREGFPSMSIGTFNSMPTALQRRMIPLLLGYLYDKQNVSIFYKSELIEQLLHHLNSEVGNISIDLPFGFRFLREYDKFTFIRQNVPRDDESYYTLPKGIQVNWMNDLWLYWAEITDVQADLLLNAKEIMYFNFPGESLPLSVRHRIEGDRIMLPGMSHTKRLSRLFIDEKVKKTLRDQLPVIVTKQDEVCAVPGLRYGVAFTKDQTTASKYIFLIGKI